MGNNKSMTCKNQYPSPTFDANSTQKKELDDQQIAKLPFDQLIAAMKECRYCQNEFGFEPRPIQWGNPDAKIVMVSQAPGLKVHDLGKPFSDLSGKKLRQKWFYVTEDQFYNKSNFYFSMAGHCFPGKAAKGHDRKPPKICWKRWTKHELEHLKEAELFLIIGQEAASRLFPGQKLEDLVFSHQTLNGKPCYFLPHPSPLNYRWTKNHPEFEQVWLPEIRAKIYEILGLPPEQMEFYKNLQKPLVESWQKASARTKKEERSEPDKKQPGKTEQPIEPDPQ